ncbi:type II toxin-antitoxin system CcdA family antitoxin [Sulfitobacter sp. F26204]|uniref:type II toxin-antitoxin system CcdA family antitoxin n=1 Tax=Sulfitobacter sp. F26204 TaxID=2996014 RepID=UPI00225DD9A4|nr:type II toxin-antitoxin system CcdA family antitoxin [Sulfitobacter sp. F26204]MCX7558689.1 type II toxin-antitoxin system CcdA family antitoxin [Sulfitobacter sp. F26204]
MNTAAKRKTSLTLNADSLDAAREYGVNVSAVADKALEQAVAKARHQKWLEENADAFAAQAIWHENNDHPLADIMTGPAGETWNP